ncbi:MAG TPA: hypothetical protein VFO57_00670, partial [Burkholderiales bacterium]|nr:hypothetical protein [Burkholderiales bacterium]
VANVAGGDITVVAGGNLALNSAAGVGTSIATTGSVTLQGSSVTSTGTLTGALVNATATAGNISLTQSSGIALGLLSSSGTVTVNSGGAITDGNGSLNIIASSANLSGAAGIGSIANPLETQVGAITLSGGGEIGIINHGNLLLNGLSSTGSSSAVYASTQFGASSATLTLGSPVSVSGNLSLLSDSGMTVDKNVSAGGALVLDGGLGDLDILPGAGNTTVQAGGVALLNGANVHLGHASQTTNLDVIGGSGLGIISAGELTVQGGSGGYTFVRSNSGNLAIATVGNVTVTGGDSGGFAHVLGSPDVVMSVGGTVQLNATDPTAPARIESALPSTIYLDFTTVPSGGYFVNGVEGVTADPELGTGFYADGVPAVLDQNLLITYGGAGVVAPSVPGVEQAVNQIIASTNQTTTITDEEPVPATSDGGTTGGEVKDKELPVCK